LRKKRGFLETVVQRNRGNRGKAEERKLELVRWLGESFADREEFEWIVMFRIFGGCKKDCVNGHWEKRIGNRWQSTKDSLTNC
jgi:hypothetical protein